MLRNSSVRQATLVEHYDDIEIMLNKLTTLQEMIGIDYSELTLTKIHLRGPFRHYLDLHISEIDGEEI